MRSDPKSRKTPAMGGVGVAVRQEVPAREEIRSGGSAAQMRSREAVGKV